MADYTNPTAPAWVTNVRRLSSTDPVDASTEDSADTKTGKDLVWRTQYLKDRMDALNLTVVGGTSTWGAALADGTRAITITHNFGTTGYGVELAAAANPAGTWGEWWVHARNANTVEIRTNGSYAGNVRWTVRRTTSEP